MIWLWTILAVAIGLLWWLFYRKYYRPMRVIAFGMDLLREQDFGSRLAKVGQPEADRIVEMFNSLMDRLKVQRLHVREQNEFLDLLIGASPMGVIILNEKDIITSANSAASKLLDTPVTAETPLKELLGEGAARMAALKDGDVSTYVTPQGETLRLSRLHFMDQGWSHPFILVERVTDEVRAAERQTLTRVIRTMAHEVNNSMAAIRSTLDTVHTVLSPDPAAEPLLPPIRACLTRADELAEFIGRFADVVRVPDPQPVLTDLHELVTAAQSLLHTICADCGCTLVIDTDDVNAVRIDPALMQQVLVNVVKNAAESASEGGTVTIRATNRTLTVTDTGPGLTTEASAHLFTALYTSKPAGHGLGLMLCAEVLRRHSARFSLVTDRTSMLTTFTITLPTP